MIDRLGSAKEAEFARRITAYGDQRAREAIESDAWRQIARAVDERLDVVRREARAAALEEAAQFIEKHVTRPRPGPLPAAIRSLLPFAPPPSEGGEG